MRRLFEKPCFYLNYNVPNKVIENWTPQKVYNFVHFRSMPSNEAVIWLNSKKELPDKIENGLKEPSNQIKIAKKWFEKINLHPANKASERIWEAIEKTIE